MADIQNPERLKVPLKDKDGYFYPITSYNQIVMPDGMFWDGQASGGEGTVKSVNSKEADENGNVEISASDIGALATDGSGAMQAPVNFGSGTSATAIGGNSKALLMRKDAAGNEYAIYDEGNKPSPADIGALSIDLNGDVVDGTGVVKINADTLQGMTLDQLKEAIMAEAVYQ